jgi:tetratricopeptide (TPR) repeat protein
MHTIRGMRVVALLSLAAPLLMGARFQPGDRAAEKEELIAKLTSDINKVDHTLEVTKDLIKRSPDAPYLADLYFRLAELYVEKSRYIFGRLMEQQPEGERTLGGDKSLEVQINKRLAIETYDKVLKDFPEYDSNDQVRFFKSHEFRELGEWETMVKEYKELVDKYPSSPWAMEARQILGDYHFDKGEFEPAESYYMAILKAPEGHMHDMARYKMGWIRINQERFKDALKMFENAVSSAIKTRKGAIGDARGLDVKQEALVALVWPFSEVRKPHQAVEYFRRLASSKTTYVQVLKKLANRYYIKTEYASSALLYREIVRLSANVEENIEYVQRIYASVRNMSKRNPKRYARAAQDVDSIVKTLARFFNHLRFKQEEKDQLESDFEIRARDLATRLHVEAQKRRDKKSAEIASEAYRKYLSLFTNAKERQTIQTNRAEALYQAEDHLEAGLQYEEIAKEMGEGDGRRDMIYSSVESYHRAIQADSKYRDEHPTEVGLLNKLELLRAREGLKQLGAFYVKSWPKDKNTPNVKYNIARMYYQQGEYERAAELFTMFVEQYPTHKDMAKAGHLALDALRKLDKYDELAQLAKRFVANPAIADTRFKNEVADIEKAARKRKVEYTVLSTSEGEFSEKMLAEWEKHKGTKEGEEYLYTAFVKFKGDGNIAGVFDFGGRIVGAYPNSKRLTDVLQTMGAFAIRAADFERAAFLFEEFARRFPNDKKTNEVLMSAANINAYLGQYDTAAKTLRQLRSSASGGMRIQAHQKLMEIYRDIGDWEQLARVCQTALQLSGAWVGARAYLGIAYAESGKDQLAQRELSSVVSSSPGSEFDKTAQARAFFTYGQLFHKQYEGVQFRSAASSQEDLQRKMQFLQILDEAYVGAIRTGVGEWAIAGLHESARAYANFGEFIASAPVPPDLPASEKRNYRTALETEGKQYVAKAQETRKACATKAEQLKVFTRFGSACVTGGEPTVSEVTKRRRAEVQDEGFQNELLKMRQQLAKKPASISILARMTRLAMQVGDFHFAKLAASTAVEKNPRSAEIQNLLGVASWHLGEPSAAYDAFEKAAQGRHNAAVINLAALYAEYGYERLSKQTLRRGNLSGVDTASPDIHPAVNNLLDGGGPPPVSG